MRLSIGWDPTNIQPREWQVWTLEVPSPKVTLWIPDFYESLPNIDLGTEVGWTMKSKQIGNTEGSLIDREVRVANLDVNQAWSSLS